jgi:hypothetical protein
MDREYPPKVVCTGSRVAPAGGRSEGPHKAQSPLTAPPPLSELSIVDVAQAQVGSDTTHAGTSAVYGLGYVTRMFLSSGMRDEC